MPKLTFYRQGRSDGGVRTGIDLDDETIYGHFEEGGPEFDPVLLWYVDLRCSGDGIPGEPQDARRWLLDQEETIRSGFLECAREVEAGRDIELYPFTWDRFRNGPPGVKMTIACATNRRIWALSLPKLLEEVGSHWRQWIEELQPAEWVS